MFRLICTVFVTFLFTPLLFANSAIITSNSFTDVAALVEKTQNPQQTLLALDDDDTLTTLPCDTPDHCQYLGGPSWYTWQSSLPAGSADRIWKTTSELLNINNFLFTMSNMALTDPAIPATLEKANSLGASTIVVTARGYNMINATENQLAQAGILTLIENGAIKTPSNEISFPGYYFPQSWNKNKPRQIAYVNGSLYLSGQNKGVMIQQFLDKTQMTGKIHTIIFVDDTYQNDADVAAAYQNDPNVNVICVYFTRLKAHQDAFLTGREAKTLQATATKEWLAIRDTLSKNAAGFDL